MLSIIIPFYNEEKNLPLLLKKIAAVKEHINQEYEIVLVNDGSTDTLLRQGFEGQAGQVSNIQYISHRKRMGKGEALVTGLKNAKGDIIMFMDADLQDDPKNIPHFLTKLEQGFDLVNGVRTKRKHNAFVQFFSSWGNLFIRKLAQSPFTDINCGFKAFKREVTQEISLYGNNFRFLPLAAYFKGFKVTEIPVANHERKYGVSKFGPGKVFIGLIDTLTAFFLFQFSERPLHFFGVVGGLTFLGGSIILAILGIERIFLGYLLYRRTIIFVGLLMVIVGVQVVMTGFLGELVVYLHKKNRS